MGEFSANEAARLLRAIQRYADTAAIDLKTPREIRDDLRCIAGQRHMHHAMPGAASSGDGECLLCGADIRSAIHQ